MVTEFEGASQVSDYADVNVDEIDQLMNFTYQHQAEAQPLPISPFQKLNGCLKTRIFRAG